MKIARIEFSAPLETGAEVLWEVFNSLPRGSEANAYLGGEEQDLFIERYNAEQGGDNPQWHIAIDERGWFETPSSRRKVVYDGAMEGFIVDFSERPSLSAAGQLLQKLGYLQQEAESQNVPSEIEVHSIETQ